MWKVALIDVTIAEPQSKVRYNLYIHCNICGGNILNGETENLLRMVQSQKGGNWVQTLHNPQYVLVNTTEIRDLEIYIKDGKDKLATFLKKPVTVTLHFKSYPFYD